MADSFKKRGNPFNDMMTGIDVVINTIGSNKRGITRGDSEHSRIMDFEANKLLIDAAKSRKVKKFILVSRMFVTRPDAFVSFRIN